MCQDLSIRPLTVWDSEYGNASFVKQTADIPADKILRLRPNRCLWRDPPPYSGRGRLWLAREIVKDKPLPWQKPLSVESLTPGRVAQSFGSILALIGTPAVPPKPRGKSPGWTKGKKRGKRLRYPVVKKGFSRLKKNKSG